MRSHTASAFFVLIFACVFTACLLSGGTHGSISSYTFEVPKDTLANAVKRLIRQDTSIHRDWRADYYNDGKSYVTLSLYSGSEKYEYVFRYTGDSTYWANSNSSEIFICYVYNGKGQGGSEGNGKWDKTSKKVQEDMISTFDKGFVKKIETLLINN